MFDAFRIRISGKCPVGVLPVLKENVHFSFLEHFFAMSSACSFSFSVIVCLLAPEFLNIVGLKMD